MLTGEDRYRIYELAVEGNTPYCEIAEAYEVSAHEIEQIVHSYIYKRGD
jgi:transposase-like protein